MKYLIDCLLVVWWMFGIVVAKGAVWTGAACLVPPVAWYLSLVYLVNGGCS